MPADDLVLAPHPHLILGTVVAAWPAPLGDVASPAASLAGLGETIEHPDDVRGAVRDLLRGFGYKPTGRGKPASEYLVRAATEGRLGPINPAVDAGNLASLRTGIPVSVVDLDRTEGPLRIDLAAGSYVFNPGGQEIDVSGLLCLHDAQGACANAVKDAQRTKTDDSTRRVLGLVWGTSAAPEATEHCLDQLCDLLQAAGATTSDRALRPAPRPEA